MMNELRALCNEVCIRRIARVGVGVRLCVVRLLVSVSHWRPTDSVYIGLVLSLLQI